MDIGWRPSQPTCTHGMDRASVVASQYRKYTFDRPRIRTARAGTTETISGGTGAPAVTAADGSEGPLAPAALVAVTSQMYAQPLLSPLMVIGELGPVAVPVNPPPRLE